MGFMLNLVVLIAVAAATQAHVYTPPEQTRGVTYGGGMVPVLRDATYAGSGRTLRGGALHHDAMLDGSYDAGRRSGAFTRRDNSHLIGRARPVVGKKGGYEDKMAGRAELGFGRRDMRYDAGRLVEDVYNSRRVGGKRRNIGSGRIGSPSTFPVRVPLNERSGCNCRLGEECLRTQTGRLMCRRTAGQRLAGSRGGAFMEECPLYTRNEEQMLVNRCLTTRGKRYAVFRQGICQQMELRTEDPACRPNRNNIIFTTTAECRYACEMA